MKRLVAILAGALFLPQLAWASTFVLTPADATMPVGRTFAVQVSLSSQEQAVNAISGELAFPATQLQVVSLSREGSIASMWVKEPTFSNQTGTIRFEGVVLNPGYQGSAGKVLSVTFRAVGTGSALVAFRNSSILANDGNGTNVDVGLAGARFTITGAAPVAQPQPIVPALPTVGDAGGITSQTHPSPDQWSRSNDARFAWSLPPDATGVQYGLDRTQNGKPGAATAGRIGSVTVPLNDYAEDGAYFFHLRYRTGDAAGTVLTRRILVDRIPPENLEVSELSVGDQTEPRRELQVRASDAVSGLDRLEVSWDGGSIRVPANAIGRFSLPALPPGSHDVSVRAVDRAGNGRVAHAFVTVAPIEMPTLAVERRERGQAWLLEDQQVFEPIVYGTALPGQSVIVRFSPRGGEDQEVVTPVGEDGTWRLPYAPLLLGSWEVRAIARDDRGALSLPAGPVTVTSDSPLRTLLSALPWVLVFALGMTILWLTRRRRRNAGDVPVAFE